MAGMDRGGQVGRSLAASYLALLVGPAAALLAPPIASAQWRWVVFAAAGLLAGAAGYALAARADPLDHLSSPWVAVPVVLLPMAYLVHLFAIMAHNPGLSLLVVFGRPSTAGLFALAPAAGAITLATRRATAERVAASTVLLSFSARPPARVRWTTYGSYAVGLGAIAGLAAALVVVGDASPAVLVAVLGIVPAVAITRVGSSERSVAVTEDGIAVDGAFVAWSDLTDYRFGERAITVEARRPWQSGVSLDPADVPDADALRRILEEKL